MKAKVKKNDLNKGNKDFAILLDQNCENIQQKILASQTKEELQKIKKEHLGKGGTISQIFHRLINLNEQEKKENIKLFNE